MSEEKVLTPERIAEIKQQIESKLFDHLGFNGCDGTYIYILTRVKEAFGYGTMTLDDFVEIDGDFVGELADMIMEFHSPVLAALEEARQTIAKARHIVEVPPAVFGEGFDWEFHYKARRNSLLKVLGNKEGEKTGGKTQI
ncbi:hypothetical protein [Paenibacillus sp. NPDC057934]|uniref:hypothetical protein n=1 Tax=Paenibacillus sp. NPDC057934 TaxID=3346282 RepID=UPI0036DE8FAE